MRSGRRTARQPLRHWMPRIKDRELSGSQQSLLLKLDLILTAAVRAPLAKWAAVFHRHAVALAALRHRVKVAPAHLIVLVEEPHPITDHPRLLVQLDPVAVHDVRPTLVRQVPVVVPDLAVRELGLVEHHASRTVGPAVSRDCPNNQS